MTRWTLEFMASRGDMARCDLPDQRTAETIAEALFNASREIKFVRVLEDYANIRLLRSR